MPIFGKKKGTKSPTGAAARAPELDQPGFYKCYWLGSTRSDPTREAAETAFKTILKGPKADEPRCIVRATVHGVSGKRFPDRAPVFDVAVMDIRVLTCFGKAMVVVAKDPGGPRAPHTAFAFLCASEAIADLMATRLAQVCETVRQILAEVSEKIDAVTGGGDAAPPDASGAYEVPSRTLPPEPADDGVASVSPVQGDTRLYDEATPRDNASIAPVPATSAIYDAASAATVSPSEEDDASAGAVEADFAPLEPDAADDYLSLSKKGKHFTQTSVDYLKIDSPDGVAAVTKSAAAMSVGGAADDSLTSADAAAMEAGEIPPSKAFLRRMSAKTSKSAEGRLSFALTV